MRVPFSLFTNSFKTGNQPDYRGLARFPIVIDEPGEYMVAGWSRTSKNGDAFIYCVLEKLRKPGDAPEPTKEENLAMLARTRAALESGTPIPPPSPFPPRASSPAWKPSWKDKTPPRQEMPPEEDDDLPF